MPELSNLIQSGNQRGAKTLDQFRDTLRHLSRGERVLYVFPTRNALIRWRDGWGESFANCGTWCEAQSRYKFPNGSFLILSVTHTTHDVERLNGCIFQQIVDHNVKPEIIKRLRLQERA